ncbi:hypothetical protein [Hoyosella subflava]|uniref:Uncharacterized protein n=1 Tax=Hoyosella subflava (strain DSM 45089 / JCM 17490 / NBRC 109087 / DQS3-9A1) TaxID=443218 RepID=F6ER62_HOYSD|nr:hypothetical protein [Hoyosella subflava]AEF40749.1 hypothetical protein AS9A_2302 [Hoyosella subflava DQS3-9A1]
MPDHLEVLVSLCLGPRVPVSGTIRTWRDIEEGMHFYYGSYFGEQPLVLSLLTPDEHLRVTRSGAKVRIDTAAGAPVFRSDGHSAWHFRNDRSDPRVTAPDRVQFLGPGRELALSSEEDRWATQRWIRPVGPVEEIEFLGRPCWELKLAPPRPSPRSRMLGEPDSVRTIRLDVQTRAVVAQYDHSGASGAEFESFHIDEELPDAVFTWQGKAVTDEEEMAFHERKAGDGRRLAHEANDWFRSNVLQDDVNLPVFKNFSLEFTHVDEKTGEVNAGLSCYSDCLTVRRRPRSNSPWTLPPMRDDYAGAHEESHYVWSAGAFDWMLSVTRGELNASSIAHLQRLLHSSEQPEPGPPLERMHPGGIVAISAISPRAGS